MKGTVIIERRKSGSHVLGGGEFKRDYDIEYHRSLIDGEFSQIESEFDNGNRVFDEDDYRLKELEEMKNLVRGSYFFDCGDFVYYVEVNS